MRHPVFRPTPWIVAFALLALLLVPEVALYAAGGAPTSQPAPANPIEPKTPQQVAEDHYNNGLRMRDRAWKLEEKAAAADDEAKRDKLLKKVEKQFQAAVREFRTAIGNDPQLFQAWSSLGYALRRSGDYEESLQAYDRALAIQPGYTEAIEYRAEAHLGLGNLDEAKTAYMTLFNHDRERAEMLLDAMTKWVESHREQPPSGVSADQVEEFAQWVDQRGEVAAQTSALYGAEAVNARAW